MSYNQNTNDYGKGNHLGENVTKSRAYGDNSDAARNATSNISTGGRTTSLDRDNAGFGNTTSGLGHGNTSGLGHDDNTSGLGGSNTSGLGRDTTATGVGRTTAAGGLGSPGGIGSTNFSNTGTNSGTGIHAQQYQGRDNVGTGIGTGYGTGTGTATGTDTAGRGQGHHIGGHHLRHADTAERHTRPTETGMQDNNCRRAGCTDRTHGHYLGSEQKAHNVGTGIGGTATGTGTGTTGLNQGGGVTDSFTREGRMASDEYGQTDTTRVGDAGLHAGNKHGTDPASTGNKPSVMDKVFGGAEKMAGKVTSNPSKVTKGEERAAGAGENISRN